MVRQVEGEKEAYRYLHEYLERIKKNKRQPFMVDILNCSKGCIYGTATELERNTDDVMLTLSDMRNKTANAGADAKKEDCLARRQRMVHHGTNPYRRRIVW